MNLTIARSAFLFLIACAPLFVSFPAYAADCSTIAGTREATANDDVVKNGQIAAGTCYNPNDVGIGQTFEAAKAYLRSLPRTGSAADDKNIAELNNSFAKCAAKFLQDFTQRYGAVTISSAYRSSASEAIMCRGNPACGALMNNPAPNGNHQKGLAIDVWQGASGSSDNAKIRDFAMQNPQYGVCFPFAVPGQGFYDRPHMILAGIQSNEVRGAGCRGVTKACDGSNFNPNAVRTNPGGTSTSVPTGTSIPTSGNPFANPYNPTQQNPNNPYCVISTDPIVVVPYPCSQLAQQPVPQQPAPQAPIPNNSSGSSGSTNTSGSSVVQTGIDTRVSSTYPVPVPDAGTLTYTPPAAYNYAASTTTQTTVTTSTNVNTNQNTNSNAQTPTGTANTGENTNTNASTGTSVPTQNNEDPLTDSEPSNDARLNKTADRNNVSNISDIRTSSSTRPSNARPDTSVRVAPVGATETFESPKPDAGDRPVPNGTARADAAPSLISALLGTLRNMLATYVSVLKTQQTNGFQGAWQTPGAAPTY